MPSQHSSLRSRVRQWCRQFRGLVSAVREYLTVSPDALDAVSESDNLSHERIRRQVRKAQVRRKPRVIDGARDRLYQMETQRDLGVGVCDAA